MDHFVIDNAMIIDGTGTAGKTGSVEVTGGVISRIDYGAKKEIVDAETIDGSGLVLAPGFIDVHSHADLFIGKNAQNAEKLEQGITTEICGQCGLGFAPVSAKHFEVFEEYYKALNTTIDKNAESYTTFGAYLDSCDEKPYGTNLAFFVPHGTLRIAAMGMTPAAPDQSQLEEMRMLLAEAMEAGAMGMSSGLIYSPGSFAKTEELAALTETVGQYKGIYTTHMRDEGDGIVEAVQEAISIARQGNAQLNVSHHKATWRKNWGIVHETEKLIRESGLKASFDIYPYIATSTTIGGMIPPELQQYGSKRLLSVLDSPVGLEALRRHTLDLDVMLIIEAPGAPQYEGKRVPEIAEDLSVTDLEAFVRVVRETEMRAYISNFCISEDDLCYLMTCGECMFGTDGLYMPGMSRFHPRAIGSFPRILGRYVREKKILSLEEAIHRMTGLAAEEYSLKERGVIREGYAADLVLFDPDTISDHADFSNPLQKNDGIASVWVNGIQAVECGKANGSRAGRVLRRGQ